MQLIDFYDGDLTLNWRQLPERVASNIELRDKIFKELQ